MRWTPCADCGTPCAYYVGSFYRCRQCGYESVVGFEPQADVDDAHATSRVYSVAVAASARDTRASAWREPVQLGLSLFSTSDK